jgi:hypothetical protein
VRARATCASSSGVQSSETACPLIQGRQPERKTEHQEDDEEDADAEERRALLGERGEPAEKRPRHGAPLAPPERLLLVRALRCAAPRCA